MYKSPIEIYADQMKFYYDNDVVNAVQKVGITVDKEELIKALQYDRNQYLTGYGEGYNNGLKACPWISVDSDHKPRHLEDCFIAYTFDDCTMTFFGEARYYAFGGNGLVDRSHFSNEGVDGMKVTHWMSIPKIPKKEV